MSAHRICLGFLVGFLPKWAGQNPKKLGHIVRLHHFGEYCESHSKLCGLNVTHRQPALDTPGISHQNEIGGI